jgi:tyrosine-protein phosphatase SIW14
MRRLRVLFSLTILGVLVGGPLAYIKYRRDNIRNFHVVRDGVLYRSGQVSVNGLKRLVYEYGIKSVVTLRFAKLPGSPPPDLDEENFCKAEGLNHFRFAHLPWWSSVGTIPAEKNVQEFLRIVNDPANYPILVHCFAGMHRTGTYCAIFRMEFDGWSSAEAIREMKHFGYVEEDWDVLGYLENYQRQGLGDVPDSPPPGPTLQHANHPTEP